MNEKKRVSNIHKLEQATAEVCTNLVPMFASMHKAYVAEGLSEQAATDMTKEHLRLLWDHAMNPGKQSGEFQ